MPVYIVTGKLGSGKTLSMVGRMKEYLVSGRPVAANIDIDLRKLCKHKPKASFVRLSDKPTADELTMMGSVHTTGREELNGALFLDECGTFLNSRNWNDKGRQAFIDWMLHSRKRGWDVYFIVQNLSLMDKQIRDAMAEYVVTCRRLDRIKIPFIGRIISTLTAGVFKGQMPQVHLALVRYGMGQGSMHADTWLYKGKELYGAYQTTQVVAESAGGPFSAVWYATEEEVAKWPKKPKPKDELIAWVQRLPAHRRVPYMRRVGLCA